MLTVGSAKGWPSATCFLHPPTRLKQVKEVAEAGLFHQQQLNNFYHLFTEIAPTIHYTVCKYLGRCSYQVRGGIIMLLL